MENAVVGYLKIVIKNFQEWIYKKASVKPSVSYLATNLPGLAVISCCETAAILWEVSKSHSEGNQNIIVLAIVNTIINIHARSVIAQVACTRQA